MLAGQLEQVIITDERIESITSFVETVNAKIADIKEADEATKRRMIDALDLTGTIKVEEGKRVLYLKWCLKEFPISLDKYSDSGNGNGGVKISPGTRK